MDVMDAWMLVMCVATLQTCTASDVSLLLLRLHTTLAALFLPVVLHRTSLCFGDKLFLQPFARNFHSTPAVKAGARLACMDDAAADE